MSLPNQAGHKSPDARLAYLKGNDAESEEAQEQANRSSLALYAQSSHKLKTLLLTIRHQHELTDHPSASQQFVCVPRLAERQPLCDQRLDLLLLQ